MSDYPDPDTLTKYQPVYADLVWRSVGLEVDGTYGVSHMFAEVRDGVLILDGRLALTSLQQEAMRALFAYEKQRAEAEAKESA